MAKRKKQSKMYTRLVDAKTRKVPATQELPGDSPKESVASMHKYLDATCECCNDPLVADKVASGKAMLAALAERLRKAGLDDADLVALTGRAA